MDLSPPLPEPQLSSDEMTSDSESEIESGSSDEDDLSGRHDLSSDLREYMVESNFDRHVHCFIPAGKLDQLIKRESILKAMKIDSSTEGCDALVYFIEKKAKKVFATTAYIKVCGQLLYRAMLLFKKNNFDDSRLPIKPRSSNKSKRNAKAKTLHPFANMEGTVGEGVDPIWSPANTYDFEQAQWRFLAPIFSTSQLNHDVGNRILPFISRQTNSKVGSFGIVSKCKIHKDHIRDPLKSEGKVLLHDSFLDRTLTSFRTIPYLLSSKSRSTTNRIIKAWPHTGKKK